jgi:hypothetical protein
LIAKIYWEGVGESLRPKLATIDKSPMLDSTEFNTDDLISQVVIFHGWTKPMTVRASEIQELSYGSSAENRDRTATTSGKIQVSQELRVGV